MLDNESPTILLERMDDEESGLLGNNLSIEPTEIKATNAINTNGNQQLNRMKQFGQLWLAAEGKFLKNKIGIFSLGCRRFN